MLTKQARSSQQVGGVRAGLADRVMSVIRLILSPSSPPPFRKGRSRMTFATYVLFCILASYLECGMWTLHVYAPLTSLALREEEVRGGEKR